MRGEAGGGGGWDGVGGGRRERERSEGKMGDENGSRTAAKTGVRRVFFVKWQAGGFLQKRREIEISSSSP